MVSKPLACAMFATVGLASAGAAQELKFYGLCEASAAAVVGDTTIAVASDDREEVTIFRLDGTATEIQPSNGPRLGDVTDVEGAARVGDVVLWLTSHSLKKKDDDNPTETVQDRDKKKRKKLIATSVAGDALSVVGEPFALLRSLIAPPLKAKGYAFDVDLDDEGLEELNIEGMAATPEGDLLIGLRSPLLEGDALVVKASGLLDAATGKDGSPAVVEVRTVGLKGNGIRDIVALADGKGYAILGGPSPQDDDDPGGADAAFPALYIWDGVSPKAEHFTDLAPGMVGEAVVQLRDGRLLVLSDNGGAAIDGEEDGCKDGKTPPEKAWFPAQIIDLSTKQ